MKASSPGCLLTLRVCRSPQDVFTKRTIQLLLHCLLLSCKHSDIRGVRSSGDDRTKVRAGSQSPAEHSETARPSAPETVPKAVQAVCRRLCGTSCATQCHDGKTLLVPQDGRDRPLNRRARGQAPAAGPSTSDGAARNTCLRSRECGRAWAGIAQHTCKQAAQVSVWPPGPAEAGLLDQEPWPVLPL